MLSKTNKDSLFLATPQIQLYNDDFDLIQDNLNGSLLIKNNNTIYLYNYYNNKRIKYSRIAIYFNDTVFWKQIDSFDQNNIKIANNIRKQVLIYAQNFNADDNLLLIGGESYIYSRFIKAKSYNFLTNNKYIYEDALYNCNLVNSHLVDYSDIKLAQKQSNIILNLSQININILKYIKNIANNVIVITCHLNDNKLKLLTEDYRIYKWSHFLNIHSWVNIIYLKKC